jgi:hypothetical protein
VAYIAGKWVGLGLGDADAEVGRIRDFMRRKFRSYAGNLPDTRTPSGVPLFDAPMAEATLRMQRAYVAEGKLKPEFANGYIGATTKVVMGYLNAPSVDVRPMLFTVCGTSVPWWVGPDADTARAVEQQYKWQPIGYPAATVPMGPSIEAGKAELRNQFNIHRAQVERNGAAVGGYSQGGCVVSEVWEEDIKPNGGRLNWAKPFLRRAVTWGNPDREAGKVFDDFSGVAVAPPNTSGVTGTLMRDTPNWWRNYAHKGDLYAAGWTGNNAASQDKTAIWQLIRGTRVFSGPDSLLAQFLELAQQPLPGAIGAFTAMFSAIGFFGSGTRDHVNYNIGPAIDYLRTGR